MNKQTIIEAIVARLVEELESLLRAAQAAHAESTHEQSKAENKYDTRALEASYLAHGQARQAEEMEAAIAAFESMEPRPFGTNDPIGVGALVELKSSENKRLYFIGYKAGGMEVDVPSGAEESHTVLVITPQSPLGQQLQGKKQGQIVELTLGGVRTRHLLAAVW